ncbi:7-carboxy-7-deazaguanine synthase QueE [Nonomuraea basaltis]|uniref:7-carboxy-7-deazaguanine synthase QueE n=1 Tax=Nonomuraea basaltis TaxID=2495887 RepID=UPI00110C56C1|nr:7-carboxy-7-deazaguanine synthase QueE [Nonomuraea basaltis]TMR95647.1 7-carboxy-7-deazaguanine synthase QueE [Nonomuraea basaltis]
MSANLMLPIAGPTGQRHVPIAELFYSFQGEGANLGRRALFVRFQGCNLTCGYTQAPTMGNSSAQGQMLCDTEYTWNSAKYDLTKDVRHLTPQEIWEELIKLDPTMATPSIAPVDLIVVTGGEPFLHKDAVLHLAHQAALTGRRMEIETNATIKPGPELASAGVAFNAGLKLASSAVPRKKRIKPEAIMEIEASGRARWKFVVCIPEDLMEIAQLQAEFRLAEIWLSPEGTTPTRVLNQMRMAAAPALEHGWNLTTREHVLIWGGQRAK